MENGALSVVLHTYLFVGAQKKSEDIKVAVSFPLGLVNAHPREREVGTDGGGSGGPGDPENQAV